MTSHKRLIFFIAVFYFLLASLVARAFFMQVICHDFYVKKSAKQLTRIIKIYPHRGDIFDRNNIPLAVTETAYSAYAFPAQIKNKALFCDQVATALGIPYTTLYQRMTSGSPFVWIKRKIDRISYAKLNSLHLHGMEFLKEDHRVYPNQMVASHVLGFVGIDNQGLSGLEYMFDTFLKGSPGKIILEGDPRGYRVVSGYKKTLDTPYEGGNIITTIDSLIQFKAQLHLKNGVEENGAISGVAIVMDPTNGDILAMASYPEFDPNHWSSFSSSHRKNRAVLDVYEPGSVFKLVTLSGVLEENLMDIDTSLYVPETIEIGTRTIKEAHGRMATDSNSRTVSEILEKSLNVGTSILARQLGNDRFYRYIQKFGFGKKTGIEIAGEPAGLIKAPKYWVPSDTAMISFGQSIAVTPLQMLMAGSVIANHGMLIKPRILNHISYNKDLSIKGIPKTEIGQIISKKTAEKMTEIMTRVVDRGTGEMAQISGFSVAGKTGTSQKARLDIKGYMEGQYVASFLGFFPAKHPQYIILVVVDTPRKSIWGSSVAAPIFRRIATDIIDYKQLIPDRMPSSNLLLKIQ